jgi:hypothetical protein
MPFTLEARKPPVNPNMPARITDWVSNTCSLITPLYEALKKEMLASDYLYADETPIKVLDKDKKGETHRGYFWVYHNSLQDMVFFDYQPGRSREGPSELLKEFRGHLQTDGYAAYNIFDTQKDITLLHCMAHARRKFVEARSNDQVRADYVLDQIRQLYAIERKAADEQLPEAMKLLNEAPCYTLSWGLVNCMTSIPSSGSKIYLK